MMWSGVAIMRIAALATAVPLLAPAGAKADRMDGRLAAQVARTSQCSLGDWGATPGCAWVNVEAYAPVIFRSWSFGSWGPLTVHDRDTGEVEQNLTDVAIPDYAAQGPWRTTENPNAADLAAVFLDYTGEQARVCEVWNFEWPWWMGPAARHGGCMDYTPGESARAFPWPTGSQASGLRYVDGVVTVSEWRAWLDHGAVPSHELQVAVPLACRSFRAPANRSDGGNWAEPDNSDCIQYGTLYELPASWSVDYRIWSPFVRLAIEMAKQNGIRVSDQTGYSVVVRVENPGRKYAYGSVDGWSSDDGTADPYGFGWDDRLMRQFPWLSLEVVS
jgi:hypothetical protein